MIFALRFILVAALLTPGIWAQGIGRFRIWMGGQEVGGREVILGVEGGERYAIREWIRIDRLGMTVEQKVNQTATRAASGELTFTWSISLAQEPLEGRALWNPDQPSKIRVQAKGMSERMLDLEPGLILWPGDQDARLREAARLRRAVSIRGFSPALQQVTELELHVVGPDPLPGFPDAVHFKGRSREGAMQSETELWISPIAGELKEQGNLGGIDILSQRTELPAPANMGSAKPFFERTLKTLPPHPFLPWVPQATLRWDGPGEPQLPEDDQQKRGGPGILRLTRAKVPTPAEAAEPPVKGRPSVADEPFLADTPLVQFRDPAFEGVVARLRPPIGASRWELARRVNRFVFDWITEKDYTVGFASALEVVHTPRGDCTEHGVLAVALLRKLGVPSRGVLGWIGAGGVMGLHFWVEVRLKDRWVPIDPTFDEAPASTMHLKLGTTDLADLGSVGWDAAQSRLAEGGWKPSGEWVETIRIEGDRVISPDGTGIRLTDALWKMKGGSLLAQRSGAHGVAAIPHPISARLNAAKPFQSTRSGLRGWWSRSERMLWIEGPEDRWMQVEDLDEGLAVVFLDNLEIALIRGKEAR